MSEALEKLKYILSKDKRRCERLQLPLELYYTILPAVKCIGPASIEDIGGEGIRFSSKSRIPVNSELTLRIEFKDKTKPALVNAVVIWCKKIDETQKNYSVGVKLLKKGDQDRGRLIEFLAEKILDQFLDDSGQIKSDL